MGRVDNAATNEFLIVNASNPASPVWTGSLNLSGNANEISVLGNYAYVASSNNSQELQVVNITNPSVPTLAGSLNLSSNTDALTITSFGSTVAIGQGSTLYLVNVTTPASPSVLGSINTGGTINDISLGNSNTYAFLASSNNSAEFQVINITTSSLPSTLESLDVSGNSGLLGIAYDAATDRAYGVSTANTQEFFIFLPQ
jgi:hypothetical protein